MRVERPPADEIPPPPAYLEASVRRPTAGIGPEARLAGLDERTELRIIVPRWVGGWWEESNAVCDASSHTWHRTQVHCTQPISSSEPRFDSDPT